MPERDVLFGSSLGPWNGVDAGDVAGVLGVVARADRDGLDLFTLADHPYFGDKLDAYAALGFLLGRTTRIAGMVSVTNLASRPAPVLARAITSLSALSGGRVVLGLGAGALWDMITRLGVPRLDPGAAVRAMEEAIILVRALSGGGDPVTFDGEFYRVSDLDPAAVAAPPVWTGSGGPKSLAVTGRLADGWVPQGGGLAQHAVSPGPAADRRGRGGRWARPFCDHHGLQLRRPDHPRATPRHSWRGRPLDRRVRPAVGRRAHVRGPGARCARLRVPHDRRHPGRRGGGPLRQGDRPGRTGGRRGGQLTAGGP